MRQAHARPLVGILFVVLATAFFVVLDTSVKYLSATLSVLFAVWFRYMFQAVAVSATVLPTQGWRSLRTQRLGLHVFRGLLLVSLSVISMVSLTYMPLGEFTAIIMLTPLVITLMAAVFLREHVSWQRWVLVVGGFAGALLVVQPSGSQLGWVTLLPLTAVVVGAVFQILTSRLARTEPALTMHFYSGWTGALGMCLALPWFWHSISDPFIWALLCLAGLMGTVGHFLLIVAYTRAPAGIVAPYLYTQIAFAMLAGWLVFDHVPGWMEIGGIALIVVCGATAAWLSARPLQVAD